MTMEQNNEAISFIVHQSTICSSPNYETKKVQLLHQ